MSSRRHYRHKEAKTRGDNFAIPLILVAILYLLVFTAALWSEKGLSRSNVAIAIISVITLVYQFNQLGKLAGLDEGYDEGVKDGSKND